MMVQPNAMMDIVGNVCRICFNEELKSGQEGQQLLIRPTLNELLEPSVIGRLIKACNCRGSFAYVHRLCLINWLVVTRHKQCDICRFKFKLRYYPKSFYDWLLEAKNQQQQGEGDQMVEILVVLNFIAFTYYQIGVGLNVSQIIISHLRSFSTQGELNIELKSIVPRALVNCLYLSSFIWLIIVTWATYTYCKLKYQLFKQWSKANYNIMVDENDQHHLSRATMNAPRDIMRASGLRRKLYQ